MGECWSLGSGAAGDQRIDTIGYLEIEKLFIRGKIDGAIVMKWCNESRDCTLKVANIGWHGF